MQQYKDWPAALQRKWLLSWAAGAAFLVVGMAVFFTLNDRPMLLISVLLSAGTALRCFFLYRTAATGRYEVVSGVCIGLGHAGLKRHRMVRMLLEDGTEYEVALDKRISFRIGNCYQLYFQTAPGPAENQGIPGQAFMDSRFLALVDLGEYLADEKAHDVQNREPH